MKLRVCTLFSGYDSQCMALDRLKEKHPEFDYELVAWAEIDKYAIQAHNAVYPQWSDRNYGDVSKIDWSQVPDFDLLTYSSPCQDFSNAGKQAGGAEGSGTRSSLLWEVRRAIIAKKPKYMLMENVAALVSKKFIGQFNKWQLELSQYGYTNYSQVLNAKDYGVPQNRERIFMVSILNCTEGFYFPTPIPLEKRLKDVLEKYVDERYYLSEQQIEAFNLESMSLHKGLSGKVYETDGSSPTIIASEGVKYNTKILQRGHGYNKGGEFEDVAPTITTSSYENNNHVAEPTVLGWVRDEKGNVVKRPPVEVANCVTSCKRDNTKNYVVEPQVMTPKRTEYGKQIRKKYEEGEIDEQRKNIQQLEPRNDGVSNTLTSVQKDNYVITPAIAVHPISRKKEFKGFDIEKSPALRATDYKCPHCVIEKSYRIRKLTERECFRLMGVSEDDIDKLIYHSGFTVWNGKKYVQVPRISKSRLYKLAGNSIVVDVLVAIFIQLLIGNKNTNQQLEIF